MPQATASEGLAQGSYVAAVAGFEPTTLRIKGTEFTNEPHFTGAISNQVLTYSQANCTYAQMDVFVRAHVRACARTHVRASLRVGLRYDIRRVCLNVYVLYMTVCTMHACMLLNLHEIDLCLCACASA